jgi:hypothetical protein
LSFLPTQQLQYFGYGEIKLLILNSYFLLVWFQDCDSIAMASETDEKAKMESLSSAAAFVEGGIQDACDDACSICLEAFCESDPSAVSCHLFG